MLLFSQAMLSEPSCRLLSRSTADALDKDQITPLAQVLENDFSASFPVHSAQLSVLIKKDDIMDKCHTQNAQKFHLILSIKLHSPTPGDFYSPSYTVTSRKMADIPVHLGPVSSDTSVEHTMLSVPFPRLFKAPSTHSTGGRGHKGKALRRPGGQTWVQSPRTLGWGP